MSVYFIYHPGCGSIKIGYAINVAARLASLQCSASAKLETLAVVDGDRRLEKRLHRRFAAHRRFGEWFAPASEIKSFIANIAAANPSQQEALLAETFRDTSNVIHFNPAAERLAMRGYLLCFLAKHGQRTFCEVAETTPRMARYVRNGGILGAARVSRLYAYDHQPFGLLFRGASDAEDLRALVKETQALICQIEGELAA